MGEVARNSHLIGFDDSLPIGFDSESQTANILNEKIFVIAETGEGAASSITVKIFIKTTGKWVTPTILGSKPGPSKGHSAILLNRDRILVLKQDCSLEDCVWFLEVDTPFVKEQKKSLGTEVVAWSKGARVDNLTPIVISGPSGVGKGTLISKLMKEFPSTFGFSVSHTTRLPREKEMDGVHYHFTERSKMEKDILEGKFLETACVHGNLYGTSIEAVETVTDSGQRCILDIDVQGARSVRASSLEAAFVFIAPPSFEELEKRLRARGTETEEQVQKRLRNAKTELEQGKTPGLFDHILVNDNLETCYEYLKKILGLGRTTDGLSEPCTEKEQSSAAKADRKFIVQCHDELGKNLYAVDASSIKGGAPGRTRGLKIDPANQLTDGPTNSQLS